jgi:flagellar basal-body rod modification protein FlgD
MTTLDTASALASTTSSYTANSSAATAATITESDADSALTTLSSDFETFLTMLTVQLENQDPLDPVDSADYAMQLATFSGVEQQVMTNDLLTSLSSQIGVMGVAQISGWVGMEARSESPAFYEGDPVTLAPNVLSTADQAFMVVRDSTGAVVETTQIDTSAETIEWDGLDSDGEPYATGAYSFEIQNYNDDNYLSNTTVDTYNQIAEARADGTDTTLILEGGTAISSTDVSALREAA